MSTRREFLATAGVLAAAPVATMEGAAQEPGPTAVHAFIRHQLSPSRFARDGFLMWVRCIICQTDEETERFHELIASYHNAAEPSVAEKFDAEQRDLKRLSEVNECFIAIDCWTDELRTYLTNNGVVFMWHEGSKASSQTYDRTDEQLFDETGKRLKRMHWAETATSPHCTTSSGTYQYVHKARLHELGNSNNNRSTV